ncbi:MULTISPECIES: GapR family DNA-binding domain-containing protein [Chelatococcus]|uniref:Uncharacterized protein (UPF0335 family) n=1 Tax=Chelatococcus caeni TaxID=1348468 RepID=A0A840C0W0_9HYPH|nr:MULTISPECIES: GapR family DNA-binding domain-containing protein [Chelatococcus]ALA16113.1 hypothetical protein AL346_00265 [Chelatococcus sp. CO-6]MBB4017622.1 uncharacterized protein (UPF0335 family) [Chelatococcus caeni]
MSEGTPSIGHNSGAVATEELRSYQQRIERLEEEAKSVRDDMKEVYAEMKARGFDVKAFKEARRRQKQESDFQAVVELYEEHLLSEMLA